MITREQAVSRVQQELKLLNKDEYYPRRAVLQTLEDKCVFLLSQKKDERKLYKQSGIYSTITCFELEEVDSIKCGISEFKRCNILMKSTEPLPQGIQSNNGSGVLNVTSIDDGRIFNEITFREYAGNKNRKYSHIKRQSYIIRGNDLYIPDYHIKAVNVDILTLRVEEVDRLSGCGSKTDCCKSYWEYPLINSDRLAEAAIQETINELRGTVRSIAQDENPNKDSNIKSKTTV